MVVKSAARLKNLAPDAITVADPLALSGCLACSRAGRPPSRTDTHQRSRTPQRRNERLRRTGRSGRTAQPAGDASGDHLAGPALGRAGRAGDRGRHRAGRRWSGSSPVETTNVQLPTGDRLQIPTGAETLRLKSYLVMCRNTHPGFRRVCRIGRLDGDSNCCSGAGVNGPVLLWRPLEETMGRHPVGTPPGRPTTVGRARHQDVGPRGGGRLGEGQGALPIGGGSDA